MTNQERVKRRKGKTERKRIVRMRQGNYKGKEPDTEHGTLERRERNWKMRGDHLAINFIPRETEAFEKRDAENP